MKKILLSSDKNFYKANLHCHTNISDGKLTPEEVKEEYKALGYSVVAYTDHDLYITHDYLNDENFLALHGFEVEINEGHTYPGTAFIKTCHICNIAIEPDNLVQPLFDPFYAYVGNAKNYIDKVQKGSESYRRIYSGEGISEMMKTYRDAGFFVTYNHPTWSQERYPEYTSYHGMYAMEIMNGSSDSIYFDEYNPRVYDDILYAGERIYCIGADDNHSMNDIGIAFTEINAENLDYRTITKALVDGNFYASEGPEIYELTYEDGKIRIKTSPAQKIICAYDIRKAGGAVAEEGTFVTEAEFTKPDGAGYFRITVTDGQGRHACTNAYFFDELEK